MYKMYWMVLLLTLSSVAFSQEDSFEFHNDNRPSHDKFISLHQLTEKLSNDSIILLDVRLKEDFEKDPIMLPGATYLDPENLPNWSSTLTKNSEVVVYCVAGKWVSQKVAFLLNERGINVSSLEGGIEAWKKSKGQ